MVVEIELGLGLGLGLGFVLGLGLGLRLGLWLELGLRLRVAPYDHVRCMQNLVEHAHPDEYSRALSDAIEHCQILLEDNG